MYCNNVPKKKFPCESNAEYWHSCLAKELIIFSCQSLVLCCTVPWGIRLRAADTDVINKHEQQEGWLCPRDGRWCSLIQEHRSSRLTPLTPWEPRESHQSVPRRKYLNGSFLWNDCHMKCFCRHKLVPASTIQCNCYSYKQHICQFNDHKVKCRNEISVDITKTICDHFSHCITANIALVLF